MRPTAPQGFATDCSLSSDYPGRLVPPRVYLETVETAARERGGLSAHFTPRLLVTQNIAREVKSFLAFSAEMKKKNEKLIQAGAIVHQMRNGNDTDTIDHESLVSHAASLVPNQDAVTKNLSSFGYFEETPLVVINPLTTAEIKKFGNALSADKTSKTIQSQRSDFAKLLEESLAGKQQNSENNKTNSGTSSDIPDPNLLPSFPDASQFAVGSESELRRKAAETFVERCKQLWEMFRSMQTSTTNSDGTTKSNSTANDDPQIQKMMAANKDFATGRFQLLKQPLVYSLQVAMCAQDIACHPYVGFSWDQLGGSAKDWQQKRITLADVFASQDEARKQIEVAVLVHKILVAICQPFKIDIRVEPADLAVLSYFALPRTDGDGNRLFELWPSGPLALFPIASFASFVPIKEASNAMIDLVAESRREDGDEPLLRIRCFADVAEVQQQQQHQLAVQQEASGAVVGSGLVPQLRQELRIWKRPISNTIPDDVKIAQEQAKLKDPRLAVAKFMQGLKGKASRGAEEREEAMKMALQLAENAKVDKK